MLLPTMTDETVTSIEDDFACFAVVAQASMNSPHMSLEVTVVDEVLLAQDTRDMHSEIIDKQSALFAPFIVLVGLYSFRQICRT